MGSSKKRKEKREKKKHKRRSRSRSHERESRKRSRKHTRDRDKKHSRGSHSKDQEYEKKKHPESSEDEFVNKKRALDIHSETFLGSTSRSQSQSVQISSPEPTRRIVEHYSSGNEEDDFDPESLLEEKLLENEEYSARSNKLSKKNFPNILETLIKKDYPNLEMFRQVIMKGDSMQKFPGDFQISITNREAEYVPVRKTEDSQDRFECVLPQTKMKVKEEPFYETERRERHYETNEWEDTEDEHEDAGPSEQSLKISETDKLLAKLGLKPLQVTKAIPGIEPEMSSSGFSQPLSRSVIETNRLREKPTLKSSLQVPLVIPEMEAEPKGAFQSHESLSVIETNKLRAKLGLKPLQVSQPIPVIPVVEVEPESAFQSYESLSVIETNNSILKTKRGLKPLQVSPSIPAVEAEREHTFQSHEPLSITETNKLRTKRGLKPLQVSPSISAVEAEREGTFQSHESLSINETNKLRAKLGLKPLQVSPSIPGVDVESETAEQDHQSPSIIETKKLRSKLRKKPSQVSKSVPEVEVEHESTFQSQESFSINETNKLRAKLGLKPLQVSQSIPGVDMESETAEQDHQSPSIIETKKLRSKSRKKPLQVSKSVPEVEVEREGTFQSQESLSISETNKLRTKLGLKPLQVSHSIPGVDAESETAEQDHPSSSINETKKLKSKSRKKPLQVSKSVPEEEAVPENDGQSQLSLSISQTNELRAKLGLKPLQVTESIPGLGATEEEKEAAGTSTKEIFVKTENLTEKREAEKLREKIKTQKEKRKIVEKLSKVKGIAGSDSEDESAVAWVKKSRKLQEEKEKAEKRAKLLEEMDAEFGISALVEEEFVKKDKSYSAANLRGLTVSHTVDSFREGHDTILTLKDRDVLDEDDDVLENVNLIDEERYARNVENRKKKPLYVPYEEPEFDEFGILKKKNILSKYDEEESSPKKTFKLGDENYHDKEKELELIRMKLKQKQGISLEMSNMKVASEYYTPEEMVQFKKPKKNVRKVRRRILKADDLVSGTEEIRETDFGRRNYTETELDDAYIYGEVPRIQPELKMETEVDVETEEQDIIGPSEDLTGVVVDEDQAEKELNAALNKARRLKQRKTVVSAPEKIVEMMKNTDVEDMDTTPESKSAPIVLNSTAEFCRTLGEIPTYGMSGNRDEEADELLDFERELIEERKKQEMEAQNRGAWNEVDIDEKPAEILVKENEPILEEEPDIRVGVAGALALAQKKGYLDKDTKKTAAAHRVSQLQAQSYTIEEKFYDDDKFGKRDRYTGPIQDFREKHGYKPDIKLEYIDDSGRLLTAKEAFRYLSHKFHGKGPGKNKVDKRMKKLEQETRLKQMSSTDTPLNTVKLLQAKQKEMQSPYIVLSGGSKTLTQTMISKTKPT